MESFALAAQKAGTIYLDALVQAGAGVAKLKSLQARQRGISRISRIRGRDGHVVTDPVSISEVFAHFYEDLYSEPNGRAASAEYCGVSEGVVTAKEVSASLKRMKNQKTGADDGLVAEMLKTEHSGLVVVLAKLFTEILNGHTEPPETWKITKLRVIFKKGDAELPKNYRPISIIPVMAKLFSTILYMRIQDLVEDKLAEEQYGFRKGRGCTDAVHVLRMVVEKSAEWGEPLFLAQLDVEKAFDRVHHEDLFKALLGCGAGARIVSTLMSFYRDLQAKVFLWDGVESKSFAVQRGVRQGDPLSTLLFNLVLNDVLEEVRATWERRGYGTEVGENIRQCRLTHVAFADDCILVAKSWISVKRMVLQLREALAKRGLSLHPSKCQVQTNVNNWRLRGNVSLSDDFSVFFLQGGEPLTVLGTSLALRDVSQHEIRNRIAAGWRLFWSLKPLLLKKSSSLHRRLRVFDSTVRSCVLWCCQSWTPRAEEARLLDVARRSMLRRIVGAARAPGAEYIPWMRRSTHKAEDLARATGVKNWVEAFLLSKWDWAGHVIRRPTSSWVWRVTAWRDSEWQALAEHGGSSRPLRPSRRRWMKWEAILHSFCKQGGHGSWQSFAQCRDNWANSRDDFCMWCAGPWEDE